MFFNDKKTATDRESTKNMIELTGFVAGIGDLALFEVDAMIREGKIQEYFNKDFDMRGITEKDRKFLSTIMLASLVKLHDTLVYGTERLIGYLAILTACYKFLRSLSDDFRLIPSKYKMDLDVIYKTLKRYNADV